jgi:hypothetical protein
MTITTECQQIPTLRERRDQAENQVCQLGDWLPCVGVWVVGGYSRWIVQVADGYEVFPSPLLFLIISSFKMSSCRILSRSPERRVGSVVRLHSK